ncbi:MAG: chloramphenicol acetyltransferase [Firmicutes bacterium]|nr:chloramphenicol acetyltransferase [Bacillota bacterium]
MRKINLETWDRIQPYSFFTTLDIPRYLVTVNLDVTEFVKKIKEQHLSFYLSFMHLAMKEMNKIDNFRYRIIKDDVFLFDETHPSFTDMIEGTDQFKFVTTNMETDLLTFIDKAKQKSKDQGNQFFDQSEEERFDVVYITTFPWASYTQVSHAHNIDKKDTIPKLAWGKFENVNDKLLMPFSIEVHHALADGLHVGRLIQNIQSALDK